MGAVALVARCDLRRRWRRVVLVALVVGVTGAVTLATAAGARRTSSALARFRAESRSADIELDTAATPSQLAQLNRVHGIAAFATLSAIAIVVPTAPDFEEIGTPTDAHYGVAVDRARIVAGRAANPASLDEVTMGEGFASRLRLTVGDHLDVESYTPAQVDAELKGANDVGAPAGPRIRLHIVGIARRPLDLGDRASTGGLLVLTPAFERHYQSRIGNFGTRVMIRTVDGAPDVPTVLAATRRVLGQSLFNAQSLTLETQGASDAIDVLALALWIAAALAMLAGAGAIAIILTREIGLLAVDDETLQGLGCTRRQRFGIVAITSSIAGAGGAVLAVVGAVALSPLFPVGVARRADPDIGVHVDAPVLALGVLAVVAVVAAIAGAAALRATRKSARQLSPAAHASTSTTAARAAAVGLGPSVSNGLRMAFERGRGRSAVPVRSAFVGATIGVLGITAAFVLGSSLHHLSATPRLYGSTFDFKTEDTNSNEPCGAGTYGLAKQPGLAALAEVCTQSVQVDGRLANAVAFTRLRGATIAPEILAGHAPADVNEVALGSKTLRVLGKQIGDTVAVSSRGKTRDYEVVGRAVFPTLGSAQPIDDGIAFTGAGYAPLFDHNLFSRFFVGRFAPGADRVAVEHRIGLVPQLDAVTGPTVPVEVDRLQQINWLPVTSAVLLALSALLAVGHALVTAVRRRRRELAILKTLGFDRRQVRSTIAWQATTLGLGGLLLGLPAGVIVGEVIWRLVAGGLGVSTTSTIPLVALVLTVPCVLVLVNLIAFLPARAAAQTRVALSLRSD